MSLKINRTKTKLQDVDIDGVKYEVVPSYKYLGFILNENLNECYDVKDNFT